MVKHKLFVAGLFVVGVLSPHVASSQITVTVPGTSNPWLAGMPDGSTASLVDVAPAQSPVLVPGLNLVAGSSLRFAVTGSVSNVSTPSGLGPDGDTNALISHDVGAENGISDVVAPFNSLVGVFLDSTQPNTTSAPPRIDFRQSNGLDFTTLAPQLKQVFFIGDGLTGTGDTQSFFVPTGATRFYLGTMDGFEWNNNSGSFSVNIGSGSP